MRANHSSIDEQFSHIESGSELLERGADLRQHLEEGRTLRVKAGFDPTAPDLHLGHSVLIEKLRTFQRYGHTVIFLIGDFTGRIGDPSGRNVTRPVMPKEQLEHNAKEIEQQIGLTLDVEKVEKRFNSEWSDRLTIHDVMSLSAHFTIASLLKRDDFAKRYRQQQPIQFLEFMYPMMQAYDSVMLQADVELGGTDQTFNLMMGRELQRKLGQTPQIVLTMPLLEGLDGTDKMSKSFDNVVRLRDSATEMVGKLMSISDPLMWQYYRLLLGYDRQRIAALHKRVEDGENPRDLKMALAKAVAAQYHSSRAVEAAEAEFVMRFRQRQQPEHIDESEWHIEAQSIAIANLCKLVGLCTSTSEAHRLAAQGGLKVNAERVQSAKHSVQAGQTYVIQFGKRKFKKVKIVQRPSVMEQDS